MMTMVAKVLNLLKLVSSYLFDKVKDYKPVSYTVAQNVPQKVDTYRHGWLFDRHRA